MAKAKLAVFLLIVLLADLAVFVVVGLGVGAIPLSIGSTTPSMTWNNNSNGAIGFAVVPTLSPGNGPMVSSMLPGDQSTAVSFGVQVTINNNCANAGQPAWDGGGADASWYSISWSGGAFTYQINAPGATAGTQGGGSSNSVTGNGYVAVSFNKTNSLGSSNPYLAYCLFKGSSLGSYNIKSGNNNGGLNSGTTVYFGQTAPSFSLTGLVGSGTLTIAFHAAGSNCGGSSNGFNGPTGDCLDAQNAQSANSGAVFPNQGSWSVVSSVSIPVQSGQGSCTPPTGVYYNGQTISISCQTGYGGANGYSLEIDWPTARPGVGGTLDSQFSPNPTSLCNDCEHSTSWKIPAGTASNSTGGVNPAWNYFILKLTSNYFVNQYSTLYFGISPQYTPGTPVLTSSNTAGTEYATYNDTVTVNFQAGASPAGNAVSQFIVQAYYLQGNAVTGQEPPCGPAWITTGCPTGQTFLAVQNGNNWDGSFSFSVNPPGGYTAIGVSVTAVTNQSQTSAAGSIYLSIAPKQCIDGATCNSFTTPHSPADWSTIGPFLLVLALVFGAGILFVMAPNTTVRLIIVSGAIVAIVALLLFVSPLFVPGAPLGGPAL
jgi:hypothetical protein